jgi:hypothetical protein
LHPRRGATNLTDVTSSADRVVPTDDLAADDRLALGWAVSADHPVGAAIAARFRNGSSEGVFATELAAIRKAWDASGRPAAERHVHRTEVRFEDGTRVTGVTFLDDDPYQRLNPPAFGLYLDGRWNPPWPHALIDWPDFGIPSDSEFVHDALDDLHRRARSGASVEIGCLGGHGRTGTALACLAILAGTSPEEAVAWVRANYCAKAVETDEQENFVSAFRPE